jgi:hypothetical protein
MLAGCLVLGARCRQGGKAARFGKVSVSREARRLAEQPPAESTRNRSASDGRFTVSDGTTFGHVTHGPWSGEKYVESEQELNVVVLSQQPPCAYRPPCVDEIELTRTATSHSDAPLRSRITNITVSSPVSPLDGNPLLCPCQRSPSIFLRRC